MASWRLAIGNLAGRAPTVPAAAGSSVSALYPLADIGNGHPDDPTRWAFEADGVYGATFDLNLLSASSTRTDAPTGWSDLALTLAGTPGLSANPVETGTFAARTAIKFYGPIYQDVEVMPGEDVRFTGGIYRPSAAATTGVRVVVMNLSNGKHWDGTANSWGASATPVAVSTTDDVWLDVDELIVSDATERTTYRVILIPDGGAGPTFYAYASSPCLTAAQDFVAIVGHNIPAGASVTWADGTTTATLTPAQPSFFKTFTQTSTRTWTLTVTQPANTLAFTAAPFIGELWAGRLIDLVACPGYPFDLIEGDLGQVRLEGGLGREDVFTQIERPSRAFKMRFRSGASSEYEDARDNFLRASRFGADPIMLAPVDQLEGAGTVWHGRVGPDVTFARISLARRTFEINLRESPWPRFR